MAVAGALRRRPPVGLWQTVWRAGERTQRQQTRHISSVDRATNEREKKRSIRKTGAQVGGETLGADSQYQILLPGTFVRPPLSHFPPSRAFLIAYLRVRVTDLLSRLGLWFSSKPGIFKPAQYKPASAKLVPTAKALHRAMYEALARGDKPALRRVCGNALRERFEAAIDARPPGRSYGWELVRYNKRFWRYPRVVDHKLMPMRPDPRMPKQTAPILRQVVVAIASRQRRVEYDNSREGRGRPVPGSEKEVDVVENVVMSCTLDRHTFVPGEWKITSLIDEMTTQKLAEEREFMAELKRIENAGMEKKMGLRPRA